MAVEKSIKVNHMTKRCDIVVFDTSGTAVMLVECKSPDIDLSQATLDQAGRYNLRLKVPLMVITNGLQHFCFHIDEKMNAWKIMEHIPEYKKL
jgi:type I site-specific restriction endonuclease